MKGEKPISVGSILEKQTGKHPEKDLILFEGKHISYREFNKTANRYSHFLRSQGLKKGDTVALLMDNRPEYLMIHAGCAKVGIIPALVNNNIRGSVLSHALNIADASALIIGHEFIDDYLSIATDVQIKRNELVFIEKEGKDIKTPQGVKDLRPLLEKQTDENPIMDVPINTRDILEYIYTSGTTGMPKATQLTQHKWIQMGIGIAFMCFRMLPQDVQYCCLPLYHNSGINLAWSSTLIAGGTFAMRRKFSASAFWDDIRKYNARYFIYIGELCRYLNNQPRRENDGDNTLERILGNGMRGDYWVEFQKRFQIKRIIEVYGSTEGVGALLNLKGKPGMIGKIRTAGVKMGEVARYDVENEQFIRNSKGFIEKCRVGERGMFLPKISSLSPFSGYKNNKKATSEKIIENAFKKGDRYFVSGDLVQLHKGSYLSFVDRLGDTFKWKGEVVATNEVADILNKFGHIEDCNVYGVQVENTEGRCGMASITPLPGSKIDLNSFASYIIENLPVYSWPYFLRLRDSADTTSSFKQIKTNLQKEGFNPDIVNDPLYFLHPEKKTFVQLSSNIYTQIQKGMIRF